MKVYKESDCASFPGGGGGGGGHSRHQVIEIFFQEASTALLTLLFSTLILPLDRYKN